MKATLIAILIILVFVVWDVTVAANSYHTTGAGNMSCNKSVFDHECGLLEDDELNGMYKGLRRIK